MSPKSLAKLLKKLHDKKYREDNRLYFVEGKKGIEEAFHAGETLEFLAVEEGNEPKMDIPKEIEVYRLGKKAIEEIKTTFTFPGALAVVKMKAGSENFAPLPENGSILCLDRIHDPGNLGTIIRTADWFGIKTILLSEECVDVYNPKVVRSTMGSLFHLSVFRSKNILSDLEKCKESGFAITSFTLGATAFAHAKISPQTVLVFGSESQGVSKEIEEMSECYTIPGQGRAESLNVAVATGIVLSRIT